VQLESVADNARDLDLAMRWGFGWAQGPFDLAGRRLGDIAQAVAADIAAGKTMASAPLPAWALEAGRTGVHAAEGSYSASKNAYVPRSTLPVYQRQLFPERVLGEVAATRKIRRNPVRERGRAPVALAAVDAGIGILSFKSKMHTIGDEVLDGVIAAVKQAEAHAGWRGDLARSTVRRRRQPAAGR
jgi:3-hydroxyacyl-CoA dehydrogenase